MSQINVDAIRHTSASSDAITLASNGKCAVTGSTITADTGKFTNLPNRNLIMNGAMQVAQRSNLTTAASGYGAVDRWYFYNEGDGRATITQATDVPPTKEFNYSYKLDVTTADTAGASSRGWVGTWLEARDSGVTLKGTSGAKKVTVQFWVKSPKTGTHIVALDDNDATDHSTSRHINTTYTVSTANTWEKKTVTFAGDTTGVFNTTTGRGLWLGFRLVQGSNSTSGSLATSWADYAVANEGAGQVNVLDNTSNDFYLTGVQVELGDSATDFEHLPYGDELDRCQRYFQTWRPQGQTPPVLATLMCSSSSGFLGPLLFRKPMRAAPTLTNDNIIAITSGNGSAGEGTLAIDNATPTCARIVGSSFSGLSAGNCTWLQCNDQDAYLDLSADL